MALDIDDYRFIGLANTIAKGEFFASFDDDRENKTCLALLQEYKAAGNPNNKRQWLRERLGAIFACLTTHPNWVESAPMWPFMDGRPMAFIQQFSVEASEVSNDLLASDTVLYLFGIRIPSEDGWQMSYRIVEQHTSLP